MTIFTHGYAGATAYVVISSTLGVSLGPWPAIAGAILGSGPDVIDWIGWKLGLWPHKWLYMLLHYRKWIIWTQILLVAPGLHVLFDKLTHFPWVPEPGTSPDYDKLVARIGRLRLSRRDLQMIELEVLVIALTALFLTLNGVTPWFV